MEKHLEKNHKAIFGIKEITELSGNQSDEKGDGGKMQEEDSRKKEYNRTVGLTMSDEWIS